MLGASNLNEKIWSGEVRIINNTGELDPSVYSASLPMEHSLADGKVVNNLNFLVGDDSGTLQLLSIAGFEESGKPYFRALDIKSEHEDGILRIDLSCSKQYVVTCGLDKR